MRLTAKKEKMLSAAGMRVFREGLGFSKYRKTSPRDPEKKSLLLELALRRIRKAESGNFLPLGFRRRRVRFLSGR